MKVYDFEVDPEYALTPGERSIKMIFDPGIDRHSGMKIMLSLDEARQVAEKLLLIPGVPRPEQVVFLLRTLGSSPDGVWALEGVFSSYDLAESRVTLLGYKPSESTGNFRSEDARAYIEPYRVDA